MYRRTVTQPELDRSSDFLIGEVYGDSRIEDHVSSYDRGESVEDCDRMQVHATDVGKAKHNFTHDNFLALWRTCCIC